LEIPAEFPMASTCLQLSVPTHATAHTRNVVANLNNKSNNNEKNSMEKEESKMIEKDGFIIFALKESEYLKEYYENLIIGKIIRGNIKITDLNIVKSYKKDMYALQTKGFVLNQSQIIIESRLESVIEEIGIEHPKFVLKKLDS
jgi:hypothetical protein